MIEPDVGSKLWHLELRVKAMVEILFRPMRWTVHSDDGALTRVANGLAKGFCEQLRQRQINGGVDFDDILDDVTATDVVDIARRGPATPYAGFVFGRRYNAAVHSVADLVLLRRECRQMRMLLCLHPERAAEARTAKSLAALVAELQLQAGSAE